MLRSSQGCTDKPSSSFPICLCQSTTGLTQLSCSQDTSIAPDLLCYKADMLRGWIMAIQIYNLEFKEKVGGSVEYLKYPKTQRCKLFAVGHIRAWSCCVVYPAVAPPYMLFTHNHCNTTFPKGSLNVHTFVFQCIKQSKLFLSQNTSLFWPVQLVS